MSSCRSALRSAPLTSHCAPDRPAWTFPGDTSPRTLWKEKQKRVNSERFSEYMNGSSGFSPSHGAALLVVDLNEFAKATGIVVVGGLGVPKSLQEERKVCRGENG